MQHAQRRIAVFVGASGQRTTIPLQHGIDTVPTRITTPSGEDRHLITILTTSLDDIDRVAQIADDLADQARLWLLERQRQLARSAPTH
jgi:hypothetical protein